MAALATISRKKLRAGILSSGPSVSRTNLPDFLSTRFKNTFFALKSALKDVGLVMMRMSIIMCKGSSDDDSGCPVSTLTGH